MRALLAVSATCGRELQLFFRTPVAMVVGTLFLALSGWQFWLRVDVLADPNRPAPFGAVLEGFLGESALFWAGLFVLTSVLTMSTIAGERQSGNWELWVTCPVHDSELVVGKWLAALYCYAVVWLPTTLYPFIVAYFAPSAASLDLVAVAFAYLAVLVVGAATCAIGVAVSAATKRPLIAFVATFSLLSAWLFAGEARHLGADHHGLVSALLTTLDLRAFFSGAARGELHTTPVVLLLCVTTAALGWARALVGFHRYKKARLLARAQTATLLSLVAVLLTLLAARHPAILDGSKNSRYTLSSATRSSLRSSLGTIKVVLARPTFADFASVYDEARRLLARMAEHADIVVEILDPVVAASQIQQVAKEFGASPNELQEGGMVLFRSGERARLVELLDIVDIATDLDLGAGAIVAFRAESVFAAAIAEVTQRARIPLCLWAGDPTWLGEVLGRELRVIASRQLHSCDVIIFAHERSQSYRELPEELALLNQFLSRGGAMLWLVPASFDEDPPLPALVSGEFSIIATPAIAVDQSHQLDARGTWMTVENYAAGPVVGDFIHRRPTVWQSPRALAISSPAKALVWAGESRIPVVASAERPGEGARVVVISSLQSMRKAPPHSGNRRLLRRALRWLAKQDRSLRHENKAPAVVRLLMSQRQKRLLLGAVVFLVPALFAAIVVLMAWHRRRTPHG